VLDAEARQPVEPIDRHGEPPLARGRRVETQHPVAGRRHGPNDQHGDREVGEHLHRCGRLDRDVEDDRHPYGRVARPPRPQARGDGELGEDDELGRPGVEVAVGQEVDGPLRQMPAFQVVARLHHALPGHRAAEPVGIQQLAQARCAVHGRAFEAQQPEGPGRRRGVDRREPAAAAQPRVHRELASARPDGKHAEDDEEVRAVVVEVGGREEQVVGVDRERRRRRRAREEAERHGDCGCGGDEEQADVDRAGQLGIPGGVGLVEGVAVDAAVERVREEGPQAQQHRRAGQHAQQRERAHADRATEQLIQRVHGCGEPRSEADRRYARP
jgi:hypothetical protein